MRVANYEPIPNFSARRGVRRVQAVVEGHAKSSPLSGQALAHFSCVGRKYVYILLKTAFFDPRPCLGPGKKAMT